MTPTIRSVMAKFRISRMYGVRRRFLLGSNKTDRIISRLPGTVKRANNAAVDKVVIDTSLGAQTPWQWLAPRPMVLHREK